MSDVIYSRFAVVIRIYRKMLKDEKFLFFIAKSCNRFSMLLSGATNNILTIMYYKKIVGDVQIWNDVGS